MPDEPNSQPWTPLLTPALHLAMAELILRVAGGPEAPTTERAEQMARNHRLMAKVIERRKIK
jgi:hypothetical protein